MFDKKDRQECLSHPVFNCRSGFLFNPDSDDVGAGLPRPYDISIKDQIPFGIDTYANIEIQYYQKEACMRILFIFLLLSSISFAQTATIGSEKIDDPIADSHCVFMDMGPLRYDQNTLDR